MPATLPGAESLAERHDQFLLPIQSGVGPVHLDHQHGAGIGWEAELECLFHRRQNALVHQFHGGGDDAGRDDLAHGVAGVVDRVENGPHRPVVLRIGRQPDPDLGDDRQRALAAHQHADQIEPGGTIDGSELNDRAVAQHGLHAENVVDGHAVLERVWAAGVGGHVAADRAGALARRIGGEVVTGAGQGLREPQVGHARLDHGHPVAEVDLEDLVHAGEHDHHAAGQRQAAAGQTGSGPASNHRRAVPLTQPDDLGNLPRGTGQDHRVGPAPFDREGVAIVDRQLRRRREHVLAAECRTEVGNQWGVHALASGQWSVVRSY